jgi:hypothetical protein
MNLFFSSGGIFAYEELEAYRDSIKMNISELSNINVSLVNDSEQLIRDSNELKVKARELGWFAENEGVIKISGFNYGSNGYSMGRLLSREVSRRHPQTVYRLATMLIAVLFYIISGFIVQSNRKFS